MASRKSLIGLGAAGAGLAGGWLTQRAVVRRAQGRPDPFADLEHGLPEDVRSRTLTMSDGAGLHVYQAGAGRAVLLLHGITLSAAVWHLQFRPLVAAGFEVVAVDLRGHGRSDATGLTLDRLAEDVAEVLEQLDLTDVVLVGHSMGGMVAIRMLAGDPVAAKGGGRVGALGLMATTADPMGGAGVPGHRLLGATLAPLLRGGGRLAGHLPGPTLPRWDGAYLLARINFGRDPSASQVALTRDLVSDTRVRVSAELILQILRVDDVASLASVDLPATVVVGTRDVVTPVRHARALADAVGGAELLVLDGCGHMVMLERPAEVAGAIVALAARS